MRVLVVGEGPTEIGDAQEESEHADGYGFLPVIVRRLLGAQERDEFRGLNVKDRRLRAHVIRGKSKKLSKVVVAASRLAHHDGFDAVVVVIDRDAKPNERRRQALEKGREAAAGDYDVSVAVGVAIEEIEAWMLADETAIAGALGVENVPQQRAPEKDKDPKRTLNELLEVQNTAGVSRRAFVQRIAAQARIDELRRRCPKGFGMFADDVATHLGPLVAHPRRR